MKWIEKVLRKFDLYRPKPGPNGELTADVVYTVVAYDTSTYPGSNWNATARIRFSDGHAIGGNLYIGWINEFGATKEEAKEKIVARADQIIRNYKETKEQGRGVSWRETK